jgi:hypothetical protein
MSEAERAHHVEELTSKLNKYSCNEGGQGGYAMTRSKDHPYVFALVLPERDDD